MWAVARSRCVAEKGIKIDSVASSGSLTLPLRSRAAPASQSVSRLPPPLGCVVTLPNTLRQPIAEHLQRVRAVFDADRRNGVPGVAMPKAYEVKNPKAAESWPWFWFDSHASSGVSRLAGFASLSLSRG